MSYTIYAIVLISLFLFELGYFRIALSYGIIDNPNSRSSHVNPTIRGGGIIFPIAILLWFLMNDFQYVYMVLGLIAIATISLLDDIITLNTVSRSVVHMIAVAALICQISFLLEWYYYIPLFILVIGFINAYNFMDGINGITGGYSLVTVISLGYINRSVITFTSESLIVYVFLSIIVFNFFNFRKKAKCFAGDVGSVSIAFIIAYLLIQLSVTTGSFLVIVLVLVYGLDTVTTIIFRIIRKENIFKAHRSHFYQFLANEKGWHHLSVSLLYIITQLVINLLVIICINNRIIVSGTLLVLYIFICSLLVVIIRFSSEGSRNLLGSNNLPDKN
jgi:UDP-GlcNAc:undecaprenyl-phosphate GlcNAc-1-phosphate transferase